MLQRLAKAPRNLTAFCLLSALLALSLTGAQSGSVDYDTDDDGLIEITYLEQLSAVRYDLGGDGKIDESIFYSEGDTREAKEKTFNQLYRAAFPLATPGMGCPAAGCEGYELTRDLDFQDPDSYATGQVSKKWTEGTGWEPIKWPGESGRDIMERMKREGMEPREENVYGTPNIVLKDGTVIPYFNEPDGMYGSFDGNRHVIANLFINRTEAEHPHYIGLFGSLLEGSKIRDLGVVNAQVAGSARVGILAGDSDGMIESCHVSGQVTGKGPVGGLVGSGWIGVIRDSHSSAAVYGEDSLGGLIGYSGSAIFNSHATGDVKGGPSSQSVGGLVGENHEAQIFHGLIVTSYATGNVAGGSAVGGLIGYSEGGPIYSLATGDVTGTTAVGGLIGSGYNVNVWAGYATGEVHGNSNVGGLVGQLGRYSGVAPAYATGNVSGDEAVGGLVGHLGSDAQISASYAVGAVTGVQSVGGLIGRVEEDGGHPSTIVGTFWDVEASGQAVGVGKGPDSGIQGQTTAELQEPTSYTGIYQAWNVDIDNLDEDRNDATGKDDFWDFGDSTQYPTFKCPELSLQALPQTIAHSFLFMAALTGEDMEKLSEERMASLLQCPGLLPTPAAVSSQTPRQEQGPTPSTPATSTETDQLSLSTPTPPAPLTPDVTLAPQPSPTPPAALAPQRPLTRLATPPLVIIPQLSSTPIAESPSTLTPEPLPSEPEPTGPADTPDQASEPVAEPATEVARNGGGCGILATSPPHGHLLDLIIILLPIAMIWSAKHRPVKSRVARPGPPPGPQC